MHFKLEDTSQLCKDLEELVRCPGPSHAIAKISPRDPRISKDSEFPMATLIRSMAERCNREEKTDLAVIEHNGNIIIAGGLGEKPSITKLREVPVTLLAHLDEITYYVGKLVVDNFRIVFPLCNPPRKIMHNKVEVYGFRGTEPRELKKLTSATIKEWREKNDEGKEERVFGIEENAQFRQGDLVIQSYGPYWDGEPNIKTPFHGKALDDRAGSLAVFYAVKELSKNKVPSKAIFTGSEEGVPHDISWDRLIRPTVAEYCVRDGVVLISDGIDARKLKEFPGQENKYLKEAAVIPYTASGKGPGDIGVFSILRDIVIPNASADGFSACTTTDYVSRSTGIKIMDDFPLISYVDWVNGKVGDEQAICHLDESIIPEQIRNIAGVLCHSVEYFNKKMA